MTVFEALKSREWISGIWASELNRYILGCVNCNRTKSHGHAPDCLYAAAIREAERMEQAHSAIIMVSTPNVELPDCTIPEQGKRTMCDAYNNGKCMGSFQCDSPTGAKGRE